MEGAKPLGELETMVTRCAAGDALAWESLVRETQSRVYGLALHYLRSPEEAGDLAQDVYVKLYGKLDRFHGGDFMPWLLRMTRNACIDRIRRRKVRPPSEDIVVDSTTPLADGSEDPLAATERGVRERLVRRAIAQLGDINREILLLKEFEGLNLQEIADQLGLPLGTVKSRSNRARLELARKVLELDPTYAPAGGPA